MTLSFENAAVYEVDRWTPPVVGFEWERHPSEAAAEELRFLLTRATRERLDPSRPTTVTMSGGWDSPSVFASACVALEEAGVDRTKHPVLPVSMTYPPDDIGNEDDFINAIADRWSVPVTWLDTDRIPLLEDSDDRARKHDDPMMQTFEGQMRYLARSSRELGARVVLDGFGGDHIFHVSSAAVIADHLFFGRLGGLWQEWTEWHGTPRSFARLAILPLLSDGARDWIGTVRGRPMDGFWDRGFPPWIVPSKDILAELAPAVERASGESASQYELRRGLMLSITGRAASWNVAFGLDEGLQMRGPLFDRRVVEFAVSRPLSERAKAGDSKKLLRLAMTGLIPDEVLKARTRKTGTPGGYFRRQFHAIVEAEVRKLFIDRSPNLEGLGIIDRPIFLQEVDRYVSSGAHLLGAAIQQTVAAERWLAVRV
jgi:asparagine synthase (glutamine-hydrolysing)